MSNQKDISIIDELLNSAPLLESLKTKTKMRIASRIDDAMKAKNWKNKDLLEALDLNSPSIVTKWLSGTHNFTVDTLVEIGYVLDISLINDTDENLNENELVVTSNTTVSGEGSLIFNRDYSKIKEKNQSIVKEDTVLYG